MLLEEIKRFRKESGLTQSEVADACKMHRVRYNKMENGHYKPKDLDYKMVKIENVIGREMDKKIQACKSQIKKYERIIKGIYR